MKEGGPTLVLDSPSPVADPRGPVPSKLVSGGNHCKFPFSSLPFVRREGGWVVEFLATRVSPDPAPPESRTET